MKNALQSPIEIKADSIVFDNLVVGEIDRYAYFMHTRRMEIEFDPEKVALNLRKHRVSFRIISARKASRNEARSYHA